MTDKLLVNTIEPEGATTTLSVGKTGKSVIITDNLKANVIKDYGGAYKIDAFTELGAQTWTCPTGVTSAEILIVAGGGGGSAPYYAGGGGAGGVVHAAAYPVTAAVVYDLTVGAGGTNSNATAGGNSVFNVNGEGSNTTVLTANGGGRGGGGGGPAAGGAGGSGGGTDNDTSTGGSSNQPASFGSPSVATGYGNAGGGVGGNAGGGGGGASAAGAGTNGSYGGAGGAGKLFSNFTEYGTNASNGLTGTRGYFGGGAGGGSYNNTVAGGAGGVGGGGTGGGTDSPSNQGTEGLANTGGGGGGGDTNGSGKAGGSGIILIRYLSVAESLFTSNGSGVLSGVNAGFGSAWVLLSTTTVSSAVATVSITANIDNTYKEYIVEMVNVVPASDNVDFRFQFGSGGGPSYGLSKTTTNFAAIHNQDNSTASLGNAGTQLANSTNPQQLSWGNTPNNTACLAGWLHLFDPASTTYVKQFYVRTQQKSTNPRSQDQWGAGYANTTTAITAIQFSMTSGNITEGTFKLYGIK